MLFWVAVTKGTIQQFFGRALVPCYLSQTPATNTGRHAPTYQKGKYPQEDHTADYGREELMMLMLPLSVYLHLQMLQEGQSH